MTEEEVAYLSNIVLAILCFVVVTALIGILFYFLGIIKIGDVNLTPQPAVPTATRAVVATSAPTPNAVQVSADTPLAMPTPTPSPQVLVLEVRGTAKPDWIEFSKEDMERVISFVDPDRQKHRLFGFCLGRVCSEDPKEDANVLLIYLHKGDPISPPKIGFYELILIEWDQGTAIVRIDRKGDPQWLEPVGGSLSVKDYAAVYVYIYNAGLFEIEYNSNPSPHEVVE